MVITFSTIPLCSLLHLERNNLSLLMRSAKPSLTTGVEILRKRLILRSSMAKVFTTWRVLPGRDSGLVARSWEAAESAAAAPNKPPYLPVKVTFVGPLKNS